MAAYFDQPDAAAFLQFCRPMDLRLSIGFVLVRIVVLALYISIIALLISRSLIRGSQNVRDPNLASWRKRSLQRLVLGEYRSVTIMLLEWEGQWTGFAKMELIDFVRLGTCCLYTHCQVG
jgi:hypothetical protein